jgi:hypothetical protein
LPAKAERIMAGELQRLGWTEQDLPARRKSDPEKLALIARLKKETTLSLKPISARVSLGTSKSANATLHRWMQSNPPVASAKEPYMIDKRTNLWVGTFHISYLQSIPRSSFAAQKL